MRQHAGAAFVGKIDALKFGTLHAVDSVVLGQSFVQIAKTTAEEIEHAAVFADDRRGKEFGFATHRGFQFRVEVWIDLRIRRDAVEEPQVEPLREEVIDEGLCLAVGEHSANLLLERGVFVQLAFRGQAEELLVGSAAPEEVRQA